MAQRRLINRSLGTSSRKYSELNKRAGKLADFCHSLFPLLVVNADDHGREPGDAFSVKNSIFPISLHPENDFESALQALHDVLLISLYSVNGNRYMLVHNFRREQPGIKYIAKSRFPEPPPEVYKREELTGFRQDSPDSPLEEKRSRREIEEKRRKDRSQSRKRETPPPETLPVTDSLKEWASKQSPPGLWRALDLNGETEKFLLKSRAKGWTNVDWEAARKNWLKKAVEFAEERGAPGSNGSSQGGKPNAINSRDGQGDSRAFGGPAYIPKP
jgi:hypothetical protein